MWEKKTCLPCKVASPPQWPQLQVGVSIPSSIDVSTINHRNSTYLHQLSHHKSDRNQMQPHSFPQCSIFFLVESSLVSFLLPVCFLWNFSIANGDTKCCMVPPRCEAPHRLTSSPCPEATWNLQISRIPYGKFITLIID